MEDVVAFIREGVEYWNAHDREAFLGQIDEAITFVDEPTGHQLVGREEFGKGFFDLWQEAYPDTELKEPILFTDGETVCFQGRFTGTHTGPYRGPDLELPPTGKHVDTPFVYIAEVRDGKVLNARIFYDRLTTLEQEGIVSLEQFAAQLPV